MGKVIAIKQKNKLKRQSLKELILHGKPYTIKIFGKETTIMNIHYKLKKQCEFFEEYWPMFRQSFLDIDPNLEFNGNYIADRFNNPPQKEINSLIWKFSEIYAENNKLTYKEFYELVEEKYSKLKPNLYVIK